MTPSGPLRLDLGTRVQCSDQELGDLTDVVIDPIKKHITHLVVRSKHMVGPARLVPIALVETADKRAVSLRCSVDEANRLQPVQEFAYLRLDQFPVDDPDWDVGIEHPLAMPYYQSGDLGELAGVYEDHVGVAYDRVPKGEVEIRRSSTVACAEGRVVGRVDGFLVDAGDHITHIVLERGHLWKRRELTIPIGTVTKVETDSVTIGLTTRQLGKLPSVPVHRWFG
jgi:sporulation protein YlmC with PRC-barrel domain